MGIIGLTGGIACGKTLASDYLARLGADVIDADVITHFLYAPGGEALNKITERFGDTFIMENGALDRAAFRAYIFQDEERIKELNRLVHPMIRKKALEGVNASKKKHQVMVVPLLIEAGYSMFCDEIWVVYIPEAEQKRRLLRRDGVDENLAQSMIESQLGFEERAKYADCIIDNTGSQINTLKQIKKAYRKFSKNNY